MTAGTLFDHLRRELELSQWDLANKVGVRQAVISRIERGEAPPSLAVFRAAYQLAQEAGGYIAQQFDAWLAGKELT